MVGIIQASVIRHGLSKNTEYIVNDVLGSTRPGMYAVSRLANSADRTSMETML